MVNSNFIQPRIILNRLEQNHPLFQVEATLNPYFGCSYNCLYCPYVVRSKISVKTNYISALTKLFEDNSKPLHIGIGTCCEPYCEEENNHKLTRHTIELAVQHKVPLQIFTKSALVLRDIDLLRKHSENGLLAVTVSLFTLNKKIAKQFEPSFPNPEERIRLIKKLNRNGIFSGAALAPLIPYIADSKEQIELIFRKVKKAGGDYILPMALNITDEKVKEKMDAAFAKVFPESRLGFQTIYGEDKFPDEVYSSWMDHYLRILGTKYDIPVHMPLMQADPDMVNIRQKMPE